MQGFTEQDYIDRLRQGQQWMRKQALVDNEMSKRFRDPTTTTSNTGFDVYEDDDDGGDVLQTMPVGYPNILSVNMLTNIAAVTLRDPDFHIEVREPPQPQMPGQPPPYVQKDVQEECRKKLRRTWKKRNWARTGRRVYFKRLIAGMGFASYRWDNVKGEPAWEHVQSWDLSIPKTVQDWQDLEWAGRRIRMSLRKAMKEYPEYYATAAETPQSALAKNGAEKQSARGLDGTKVRVWVYWDKEHEVHAIETGAPLSKEGMAAKVVRVEQNRYGEVPIMVMEGDIDPTISPFGLGHGIMAAGVMQEYQDCTSMISNMGKHGGPMNVMNEGAFSGGAEAAREAYANGQEQGVIIVKDLTEPAVVRIPGEQVSEAMMMTQQTSRRAVDEVTGVDPTQRGEPSGAKTATESSYIVGRSGARTQQSRTEYELFLDGWAEKCVWLWAKFGGPVKGNGSAPVPSNDPEDTRIWEAFKLVSDIKVVEASTTYRDPQAEKQEAMQVYQLEMNLMPGFMNLAAAGVVQEVPNIKNIRNRLLSAMGVRDTEQEWVQIDPQVLQQLAGAGKQGPKAPSESLNYADAPEDIKRQIEAQAGLQPSQMGTPMAPTGKSQGEMLHEGALKEMDQQHQARLEALKQEHALEMEQLKQAHSTQLEAMKAQTQTAVTAQQAQLEREKMITQAQTAKETAAQKDANRSTEK